jgi:hypothetical protein
MAIVKKISELTPKGSNLGNTDLLIVGVDNGSDYDLKSVTGAQLLGTVVSQTITDGVTTKSPSENVVFDALALKVDKVAGSRLITSAEATILGNTSGTNTGDETVTTIKTKLGISTLSGSNTGDQDLSGYVKTTTNQTIGGEKTFSSNSIHDLGLRIKHGTSSSGIGYTGIGANENQLIVGTLGASQALTFPNTANYTYTFPSATGTLSLTSDLTNKVDSNTAITGATKTKITYDSKGLVTSGVDATTSDISDSLNKRYVTDANLTTIGNTSGTNTGDQTISDATITTTDITTNNVSSTKHGFAPKTPNNTTTFLRGDGTWATPLAGGLTYFTEAQNTTAPNATVPVDSLTAVTGTTNGDFAIIPKGSGAIVTAIPDSTITGGNKRGIYAVDFQRVRASAAYIAGGDYSALLGGYNNYIAPTDNSTVVFGGNANRTYGTSTNCGTLSGNGNLITGGDSSSIIGGGSNTNNSSNSVILGGGFNSITGNYSVVAGGGSNNISGIYSLACGSYQNISGNNNFSAGQYHNNSGQFNACFGMYGASFSHSSRFVLSDRNVADAQGGSQKSNLITTAFTTSTTPVSFITYNGTAIALVLQNNNSIRFKGMIIARQSGSTNTSAWDFDGIIQRGANAASTTLLISNVNVVQNTPAWGTPTLTANTATGGLDIKAVGVAATNIKWVATFETVEVIYA